MIQSFKCDDTEALHQRHRVARWVNIEAAARRKLDQLDAASELRDMAAPPGNRLEALSGNRAGQHSIRVNDQIRDQIADIDDILRCTDMFPEHPLAAKARPGLLAQRRVLEQALARLA